LNKTVDKTLRKIFPPHCSARTAKTATEALL